MNILRILSKLTPAAPASWALEAFRGAGGSTKQIDESVNNGVTSVLGKYLGTNLTSAER